MQPVIIPLGCNRDYNRLEYEMGLRTIQKLDDLIAVLWSANKYSTFVLNMQDRFIHQLITDHRLRITGGKQ
jgi:hypothetical protein